MSARATPRRRLTRALGAALLLGLVSAPAPAQQTSFIERQSPWPYPETMNLLQSELNVRGFDLLFIQRVDQGLAHVGVETGKYRVLVFSNAAIEEALASHPELSPVLPLRIALTEAEEAAGVSILAMRPTRLGRQLDDTALAAKLTGWETTLNEIVAAIADTP